MKSYKTQCNMFNINIAVCTHSPRSKIFSTKIGFTVHRSHFDGRRFPSALSGRFNKSRGGFSSYPAAAEFHGIKEICAAPVNLGLLRGAGGAVSWRHSRPTLNTIRIFSEASTRFALLSAMPGDAEMRLVLSPSPCIKVKNG